MQRRLAARLVIGVLAATGLTLGITAPATAAVSAPQPIPAASTPVGDGEWSPSHPEETRIIPLCRGPLAVADWLRANFSDHGADIERYIAQNSALLTRLASGTLDPFSATVLFARAIAQIPAYALSDTFFHIPASTLALATGCGFLSGSNPISAAR